MLPPNSRTGQVHVREPSLVMSLISLVERSDISAVGWAVAVTDAAFSSWSSAIETKKASGDLVSVYTTRGITTRKMQKERDTNAQPIIPSNREQSRILYVLPVYLLLENTGPSVNKTSSTQAQNRVLR